MQGEAETRQLPRLIDLSLVCFLLVSLSVLVAWCQGWCVRTSKLDSGLGNLRTNQWRQYLCHPGTAYTYRPLEVRVVQGPLHQQCEHGLICDECQWQICQFWCSWVSLADWSAQCYAVSNGPIWGCWTLMPPSVSLFLTVWVCSCLLHKQIPALLLG